MYTLNLIKTITTLSICSILRLSLTSGEKLCSKLQSNGGERESDYKIYDGQFFVDLSEEHFISRKDSWGPLDSITVQAGCTLNVCDERYFSGSCNEINAHDIVPATLINPFNLSSLSCSCLKESCTCKDIPIRKSTCAQIILGPCKNCNVPHLDLKVGSMPHLYVNYWEDKRYNKTAVTLRLNSGCQLRVFEQEDFDGWSLSLSEGFIEEWSVEQFHSYECSCTNEDDQLTFSIINETLVSLPQNLNGFIPLLRSGLYKSNPGLIKSLTSYKNGRSSQNAYVVLFGTAGSGKSSALNFLLGQTNLTAEGEKQSTTTDIHEFRINIPPSSSSNGTSGDFNSQLRIIDTPGLGDTRGLDQDAKFLATIDEYLTSHEELKNRIPNLVFIVHKFTDNRFSGEGSSFVKMLRGIDLIQKRITDDNYSNVIFLFTNFLSELPSVTKNPKERLTMLKTVIQTYTQFPKPISIVFAENKPEEHGLLMTNGDYEFPNGDLYPKNILMKLQSLTRVGGDPLGFSLIKRALETVPYSNLKQGGFEAVTFKIVQTTHEKVSKYLGFLSAAYFSIDGTPVSTALESTFLGDIDQTLYPNLVKNLKISLNIRNINLLKDIPRINLERIKFMANLCPNKAELKLLERAFQLKPLDFPDNILPVPGYSYDVLNDMPLTISPINLKLGTSLFVGYLFPETLQVTAISEVKDYFLSFPSRHEYFERRQEEISMESSTSIISSGKMESFKLGFNIVALDNSEYSEELEIDGPCVLTAVREYRVLELQLLDDKSQLNSSLSLKFTETLQNLRKLNQSSHESIESWKNFFKQYGTHLVESLYAGGAIEIHYKQNNSPCKPQDLDQVQRIIDFFNFIEDPNMFTGSWLSGTANFSSSYHLVFRGGDFTHHSTDLLRLQPDKALEMVKKWKDSLRFNPVGLTIELKLIPLSHLIQAFDMTLSQEVENNAGLWLSKKLVYVPGPCSQEGITGRSNDFGLQFAEAFYANAMSKLKDIGEDEEDIIYNLLEEAEIQRKNASKIVAKEFMLDCTRLDQKKEDQDNIPKMLRANWELRPRNQSNDGGSEEDDQYEVSIVFSHG